MERNSISVRKIFLLTVLVLTIALVGTSFAAPGGKGKGIEKLLEKAVDKGQVSVIVGLNLPGPGFRPEGALESHAAIGLQRAAIAARGNELIQSMAGYAVDVYDSWETLPYVAMKVDASALTQLANSSFVTTIQEDAWDSPHLASTTEHIGSDVTWDAGFGGLGRTVVILDTGIDADHPFYGGRVVAEACFSGGSGNVSLCPDGTNAQAGPGAASATTAQCWSNPGDTTSTNICTHGSHVAGIAAGQDAGTGYSGVAPEASIIAIQVFSRVNDAGDCSPSSAPCVKTATSDQLDALQFVDLVLLPSFPGITSINMSLGGGAHPGACDGDSRKAVIDSLLASDIATVITSGNNGWTDTLGAPGCISTAVTVGGVADPTDDVFFNMNGVVDLLAVGVDVDSSVPDDTYANKGGTSMAAPQVTGAFAMIKAIDPSMTVADILNLLQTTGVLVTDTRPANNPAPADGGGTGSGHVKPRIQLDAAVASLLEADLRVFKDCKPDVPLPAGETGTCFITVQNLGPDPALTVMVEDEHVSNGTFEFGTVSTEKGSCETTAGPQINTGTATCDLGSLDPGETVHIEVEVIADEPQDVNDMVFVSALTLDPNTDNNYDGDGLSIRMVADLELDKTDSHDPVVAGTQLTYTLVVTNNGPSDASNVVIEDNLPAGVTIDSVAATVGVGDCNAGVPGDASQPTTCAFDTIPNGYSKTMQVVVTVLPEILGTIHNDAQVSSEAWDPDNSNDYATENTNVVAEADLSVIKSDDPDPAIAGRDITYKMTVANAGPSLARSVMLVDTLPSEVSFDKATVSGDNVTCVNLEGSNTVECNLGDMAVGSSIDVYIEVHVDPSVPDGTIITNTATVTSSTSDPSAGDNTATEDTAIQAVADMMAHKYSNNLISSPSETIIYTIDVVNLGPSDAQNVQLVDTLPLDAKKIVYVFDSGAGACSYDSVAHTVTCNFGTLTAGTSFPLDIHVKPKGAVGEIANTAVVSSTTTDPDASNDSSTNIILVKGGGGKSK